MIANRVIYARLEGGIGWRGVVTSERRGQFIKGITNNEEGC